MRTKLSPGNRPHYHKLRLLLWRSAAVSSSSACCSRYRDSYGNHDNQCRLELSRGHLSPCHKLWFLLRHAADCIGAAASTSAADCTCTATSIGTTVGGAAAGTAVPCEPGCTGAAEGRPGRGYHYRKNKGFRL